MEAELSRLADFVIAIAELAEAEGRSLRRAAARLGQGMGMLAVATFLAVAGACLVLWGIYQYIETTFTPASSALLTGLFALLLAGGLAWIVHRITH